MRTKAFGIIAMLLVALLGVMANANAALEPFGIKQLKVYVGDIQLNDKQILKTEFERDSSLDVKVVLQTDNQTSAKDVEVRVFLTGSKDDVSDVSEPFDVQARTIYTKSFTLNLPQRVEDRDYQLRVDVSSPNSNTESYVFPLTIAAVENSMSIKEVAFSPNSQVVAGRSLTAVARIKNFGKVDESDVKVVFSIPELNLQETDYINNVDKDETVSSEEVLFRIPATTKTGEYTVKVDVYYDDYDEKTSATYTITVVGDSQAAQAVSPGIGQTNIVVGMQSQTLARGENGVVYPITLSNNAVAAKTYTLGISGASDWATTKISPSNVIVLNAGESKTAYVYVAASEAATVGEHVFSVDVKVGNDVVQQIPMKADVLESAKTSAWDGVKKALQIGVVMLVVLIVALGVVILYQRKFKNSSAKEDEQIAQTYY